MKNRIYIILVVILLLVSFQLTSCSLIEDINGILGGFQSGKPEAEETTQPGKTVRTDEAGTPDDLSMNDDKETGINTEETTTPDYQDAESYTITPADKKGMKSKVETQHYIFYFNSINEDFLNTYIKIAEDGYNGIGKIFGEDLDKKIEIFLCESPEEFKIAADGISPPGFDGSEPVGQVLDGVVYIYRAEEFKPGPTGVDEVINYKIALLHEIGHAYYFVVYPNAFIKNDWLNEALADKSITGENINPHSISNDALKELILRGDFIPLSELESSQERKHEPDDNNIFEEYISFVNFISLNFGFDTLHLFLGEYDSSKDFTTSLEAAIKLEPSTFEEQWLDAIESGPSF